MKRRTAAAHTDRPIRNDVESKAVYDDSPQVPATSLKPGEFIVHERAIFEVVKVLKHDVKVRRIDPHGVPFRGRAEFTKLPWGGGPSHGYWSPERGSHTLPEDTFRVVPRRFAEYVWSQPCRSEDCARLFHWNSPPPPWENA